MSAPDPLLTTKRRLLDRIADADRTHLDLPPDDAAWQPFMPGVQIRRLAAAEERLSYLLRFEPGACLPAHRHPADEECIVLSGHLCVGTHTQIASGAYHLAHAGSLHPPIRAPEGATVFLRGAVPHKRDLLL
jgi:quercetin dioxygenase-like cupin family protein